MPDSIHRDAGELGGKGRLPGAEWSVSAGSSLYPDSVVLLMMYLSCGERATSKTSRQSVVATSPRLIGFDPVHSLNKLAVFISADQDVIAGFFLPSSSARSLPSGLYGDDAADSLPLVIGPLHEAVDERPQEAAGAELKNHFRKGHMLHFLG